MFILNFVLVQSVFMVYIKQDINTVCVFLGVQLDKKHSISVISNACGVKPHTLRIWEKRYSLFQPLRDDNGKRFYSDEDLGRAKLIVKMMNFGYSISELADYTIDELRTLLQVRDENFRDDRDIEKKLLLEKLFHFLEKYDLKGISKELQYARLNLSTTDYILNLILPVIREVGMKVNKGEYSISQEHIISTIIRDQLSQIFIPAAYDENLQIALATPEGNQHEFSILIADILIRANRISTRYLGAAHPADCLAEALNALNTSILVLGVISSPQWNYEQKMIPFLKEMDKKLTTKIRIVLGGGVDLDFPAFNFISEVKVMKSFSDFERYLKDIAC